MTFRNIFKRLQESMELFFQTVEYMMLKFNQKVL